MAYAPKFFRPCWAEISASALRGNFRKIQNKVPHKNMLAVVKANAYGHGLIGVAKALSPLKPKFFGITSIEEALELRQAGVRIPSLILGNIFPFSNLDYAIRNGVRVTVASAESAAMCGRVARRLRRKVYVHAKVDSGMGRIGVNVAKAVPFVDKIASLEGVVLEGLYTHFSDSSDDPHFTQHQIGLFSRLVSELKARGISIPYVHCANSAGIQKYPDAFFTLVRPGISLYGILPTRDPGGLEPVLSWKSRIVFLKDVPEGCPISYARTFVTKRRSRIATAAFGYADGFRRSFSNNAQVLIGARRAPVIGRVTMDMVMIDATDVPSVRVGDEVVVIGRQGSESVSAWELADRAGTSPYEILCNIAARVPRVMVR